jgi:hypothetical protein
MKQDSAIRQLAGEGELTIEVPDYPVIVEIAR